MTAPLNTTLKLLPAQSAALSQQITLRYDEVNDSRCPKDKQCVLAGKIVYHFTLTARAATETFDLTEDKPEFSPVMLKGMRIVLANPTVPPVPGALAKPIVYPVNLNVFQD